MIIIFKKSSDLYHEFVRQIFFFKSYIFTRNSRKTAVKRNKFMKLTTKGRYAVMAMADLAYHSNKKPVSLTEISLRQNISLSYLEQLFIKLKSKKLVRSLRGSRGGYTLEKPASEIKLSNIFYAVEEEVRTLNCKKDSKRGCNNKSVKCITHNLWDKLDNHINGFFENVRLDDLLKENYEQ